MSKAVTPAQLHELVRLVQSGFSAFHAQALAPHKVSLPQYAALVYVSRVNRCKMSEVASTLRITLPAVTNLVDRLERTQMMRRQPHPQDRRAILLAVTPKGMALVEKVQQRVLKIMMKTYRCRNAHDQQVVYHFMQDLGNNVWDAVNEK